MTKPWRRALAAALALNAVVGSVLVAGAAQAQAVTTGTLSISGDSNDSATGGKSHSYSTAKGAWFEVSSATGGTVNITVIAPDGPPWGWDLHFDAPGSPDQPVPGHSPVLVPGTYTAAKLYPGNGTSPGLRLYGGGYGCDELTGSFTVKKAVFGPSGYVQAFDATFEQHCDGVTPAARGEVSISNPPPPPPSPTVGPTATSTGGALAGGGTAVTDLFAVVLWVAATITLPTTTLWAGEDRAGFIIIVLGVIAVVILIVNVVLGVRSRRLRQEFRSSEARPAGPTTMEGAVIGPSSADDSVVHRSLQRDPSPPVACRSVPGKVITLSVVLAVRGILGLLLTLALISASHLRAVQELPLPSWYANVLWLPLGICAGQVVFGLLLLLGKQWPRMLALSVLWFDIASGALIISLATTASWAGLFGIIVDVVLVFMLFGADVQDWCY